MPFKKSFLKSHVSKTNVVAAAIKKKLIFIQSGDLPIAHMHCYYKYVKSDKNIDKTNVRIVK